MAAVTDSSIIPIDDLSGSDCKYSQEEKEARCKLASVYRLVDMNKWTEGIYNHISLRAPGEDDHFLLNPFGLFYSEVTAASLVKVDLDGKVVDPGTTDLGVPYTGFVIHSAIHTARKDIKCIIHVHTGAGIAVGAMKCGLLPLSLEAASPSIGEVSYHDCQGISVDSKERKDLAADLGPVNNIMILRNHGLLAMGGTIEQAWERMETLMLACESQVKAMSAGIGNLILLSDEVVEKTRKVTDEEVGMVVTEPGLMTFEANMRLLDRKGYKTGYQYKLSKYIKRQ